jgi:tetratricopeptide (TPR) repeat protein
MGAERDELVKRVFPQLRHLCEDRDVAWSYVDLRWGVPEELIADGHLLPICLAEIDRCSPFFIGILGERYGTVPDSVPRELLERESWLLSCPNASITEIEIRHGFHNQKDQSDCAFFYFRESASHDEESPTGRLPDNTNIGSSRLLQLKQEIALRASRKPVIYRSVEQLANSVLRDLSQTIDILFPKMGSLDPIDREYVDHELYARSRARFYIPRSGYFERLTEHACGSGPPLFVLGQSGSGKSSLLAAWMHQYAMTEPEIPVTSHFVGSSSSSSNWRAMVVRVMMELARQFGIEETIPVASPELPAVFEAWLRLAASRGRYVLILDGIDQMETVTTDIELSWLPRLVPAEARLVISTTSIPENLTERKWPTLYVELLDPDERRHLIRSYLSEYGKLLNARYENQISLSSQCGNALYLRVLLDELCLHPDSRTLDQPIQRYLSTTDIPQLLARVLDRYEADYDRNRAGLVHDVLTYLWASRRGLSEGELFDLLGTKDSPLPYAFWSPFRFALDRHLVDKRGLFDFSHKNFRDAVEARYLAGKPEQRNAALSLAEFFRKSSSPSRTVDELPWQLCQAGEWDELKRILEDLKWLQAIWEQSRLDVLTYWRNVESYSSFSITDTYAEILKSLPADGELLEPLAWLFSHTGHFPEAIAVRNCAADVYRRAGNELALKICLGELSADAFDYGDLELAANVCREQIEISERTGDMHSLQQGHGNMGNIFLHSGKLDAAMHHYEAQERICLAIPNPVGLHRSTGNQAKVWLLRGDAHRALMIYRLDEQMCRSIGDRLELALNLDNQASILAEHGQLEEALKIARENEPIILEIGQISDLQTNLALQGSILCHLDLREAMNIFRKAEDLLIGHINKSSQAAFYLGMGASILSALSKATARSGLMELAEYSRMVDVAGQRGEYLTAALSSLTQADSLSPNNPDVAFTMGMVLEALGKRNEALAQYERALELRPEWAKAELKVGSLLVELNG